MPLSAALSRTAVFPTYLLASVPFRRRSSAGTTSSDGSDVARSGSVSSTASNSAAAPSPTFLTGNRSVLRCARCLSHLCSTDQIISKGFTGRHGRAYLVAPPPADRWPSTLPNTEVHKPVPRQLVTGAHTVSDISCLHCEYVLGWKYVAAEEESQRYKVGKFILETKRVQRGVSWENGEEEAGLYGPVSKDGGQDGDDDDGHVSFDSQDEDECEDLFMGIWSEALARKRRGWRPRAGPKDP